MKRIWIREELSQLYHNEKNTLQDIGNLKGVTREAVRLQMNKLGIPTSRHRKNRHPFKGKVYSSLNHYLSCRKSLSINKIPRYLLPFPLKCQDCQRKRHLHIHHIIYPALSKTDIQILCASCHQTRHRKGMTWIRQLDLYRDKLSGMKLKDLTYRYNINKAMIYRIIRKIKNWADD